MQLQYKKKPQWIFCYIWLQPLLISYCISTFSRNLVKIDLYEPKYTTLKFQNMLMSLKKKRRNTKPKPIHTTYAHL